MYGYLKSLENQSQVIGTLFDLPPSTKFSPNIKSLSDPSEKIIGAFNVFSNRTKVIYIDLTQKIPGINPIGLSDPAPFVADPFATMPCIEAVSYIHLDVYKRQVLPMLIKNDWLEKLDF